MSSNISLPYSFLISYFSSCLLLSLSTQFCPSWLYNSFRLGLIIYVFSDSVCHRRRWLFSPRIAVQCCLVSFHCAVMVVLRVSFLLVCPTQVTLITFAVYVTTDPNNTLDAQKAFVSLTLFNLLRFPMSMFPMLVVAFVQVSCYVSALSVYNLFKNFHSRFKFGVWPVHHLHSWVA